MNDRRASEEREMVEGKIVRLQRHTSRTIAGRKYYNYYLTLPTSAVNALGLKPGAAFEAFIAQHGDVAEIIYVLQPTKLTPPPRTRP